MIQLASSSLFDMTAVVSLPDFPLQKSNRASLCMYIHSDFIYPQINFPMCTIASMPRLPEHCIEYARMLQWPKDKPFGGTSSSFYFNTSKYISA